ncbi:hypothetical protein TVAG_259780 [Trichomonas vaginalis G3]|uniref:Uncharacterized protein n=1 Tax=Trichomonas vaginalis (strain ATCC PRA-98 / G3) TaxID=412133 RepID=A2GHT9_TRIV3|nr:hypothetical protein TVAGG3_0949480 [Trichomonas vaginalis G3]EAX83278.1 hypothetical protein TVAG_259780 [Trichomonas vaginalis G3]KAI5487114.1 hypothetical protein TVAGG3_0949480 [Trichomonas vaginalis G3]|eukprot:XP_001296208.1 hypothetical protein [Trichomonas vaginalis G3]
MTQQAPPPPEKDRNEEFKAELEAKLDKQLADLLEQKRKLTLEQERLNEVVISLQRRNADIIKELEAQSLHNDERVAEQGVNFEKAKKECELEIQKAQEDIKVDFAAANKVLIENRKKYHHLVFNLNEKKEVEEQRKVLLAQEAHLKELSILTQKQNREEREKKLTEIYNKRDIFKKEAKEQLEKAIEKAKEDIIQEKNETLRVAQAESKTLSKLVVKAQKAVVELRDKYNDLLEEENNLEMKLMEAKLVTQLTTPEQNQQTIQNLKAELDKLEQDRVNARTKPEADSRRKFTQHMNMMKKKKNELNGFIKLNQLKRIEMNQLRALASNVIEQRQTLMTFMNETITKLRKEIASAVNQKGLNFRTSELILCHLTDDDQNVLGRMFQGADDPAAQEASEQLRFFEVLYSRFTGIVQPRKIEE